MIAKIQGAKRKRDEVSDQDEDVDMNGTDEADEEDRAEGWMDVDEDESAPKKLKTNSGRVVNKREPKSNRQLAGLRDEAVSLCVPRRAETLIGYRCTAIQESYQIAEFGSTA